MKFLYQDENTGDYVVKLDKDEFHMLLIDSEILIDFDSSGDCQIEDCIACCDSQGSIEEENALIGSAETEEVYTRFLDLEESSFIGDVIWYSEINELLVVFLSGERTKFYNFTQNDCEDWETSLLSTGAHFNMFIKGIFPSIPLGGS